jgi:hypothetical protein
MGIRRRSLPASTWNRPAIPEDPSLGPQGLGSRKPPEVFGHAAPVRQSLPVEWCGQSLSGTPYRDGLVAGLNFAIRRRVRNPPSKYQAPFPSETMTVVVPEFKVMAKHELDFQRPEVRSQKLLCPKYGAREAHK